jgi:hypothetical protein
MERELPSPLRGVRSVAELMEGCSAEVRGEVRGEVREEVREEGPGEHLPEEPVGALNFSAIEGGDRLAALALKQPRGVQRRKRGRHRVQSRFPGGQGDHRIQARMECRV